MQHDWKNSLDTDEAKGCTCGKQINKSNLWYSKDEYKDTQGLFKLTHVYKLTLNNPGILIAFVCENDSFKP